MQIISGHQKYNLGVLKLHKFARTRIIAIPDEDSHHSFFAGSLPNGELLLKRVRHTVLFSKLPRILQKLRSPTIRAILTVLLQNLH